MTYILKNTSFVLLYTIVKIGYTIKIGLSIHSNEYPFFFTRWIFNIKIHLVNILHNLENLDISIARKGVIHIPSLTIFLMPQLSSIPWSIKDDTWWKIGSANGN